MHPNTDKHTGDMWKVKQVNVICSVFT